MSHVMPTEGEQRAVEDAARDPEARWRLVLLVGDRDYSAALDEGEWGQSEIPISLDATLSAVVPRRYDGDEVLLYAELASPLSVLVPQMVGHVSSLEVGEDLMSTEALSASAGALFGGENAVRVEEELEFPGNAPEHIARHAARLLPYRRVEVEAVPGVTLAFAGDGGFRAEEEAGAILSRLGEQVPYLFLDTKDGGFRARLRRTLSRTRPQDARTPAGPRSGPRRSYRAEDLPGWRPPARTELYYEKVAVFDDAPRETGPRFAPVFAAVPYRAPNRRPFAGQTRWIPLSDPTEEAPRSAAQRARDEAVRLANLTHAGEVALPAFDALIERGDAFRVAEVFRDDDGLWDREWACEVASYRNPFSAGLDTVVSYVGTLLEEERVAAPALVVPGVSAGVFRAPYGAEGPQLYFDESLAWAREEGDELVLSESGPVALEGDEVVVR